jgi:hypothetical protein
MEYADFSELTRATLHGMHDRIPAKYREGFEQLLEMGELRLAVEDLLATLEDDQVPITPAERGNLVRMLAYLKEPASRLDKIRVIAVSGS